MVNPTGSAAAQQIALAHQRVREAQTHSAQQQAVAELAALVAQIKANRKQPNE